MYKIGLLTYISDLTHPNLSIYHLSAILKQRDYFVETKVLFLKEKINKVDIEEFIRDKEVLGISALSFNWANAKLLIKTIRDLGFKKNIILGGVHPTHFPEHVLKVSYADIVVIEEGERSLLNVVSAIKNKTPLDKVKGIVYKTNKNKIVTNPRESLLETSELELLPLPDYDQLCSSGIKYSFFPYESSRGCLFSCYFCSIPFRSNWRGKSAETVVNQLEFIGEKYKNFINKGIMFVDDCFTADIQRAINISEKLYTKKLMFPYAIEARITDLLDKELLKSLSKTNIFQIQVGIECGYDSGLKMVKKALTTKQILDCAKLLKKYGLNDKIFWSFIVGFPWESKENIMKTVQFAANLVNKYGGYVNVGWYTLYPSYSWTIREKNNVDVDESIYDTFNLPETQLEFLSKTLNHIDPKWIYDVDEIVNEYRSYGLNIYANKA